MKVSSERNLLRTRFSSYSLTLFSVAVLTVSGLLYAAFIDTFQMFFEMDRNAVTDHMISDPPGGNSDPGIPDDWDRIYDDYGDPGPDILPDSSASVAIF